MMHKQQHSHIVWLSVQHNNPKQSSECSRWTSLGQGVQNNRTIMRRTDVNMIGKEEEDHCSRAEWETTTTMAMKMEREHEQKIQQKGLLRRI